jgi:hypothetical protein
MASEEVKKDVGGFNRRDVVVGAAAISGAATTASSAAAKVSNPAEEQPRGYVTYRDPNFIDAQDTNYKFENMPNTVAIIKKTFPDLSKVQWGYYQELLDQKGWTAKEKKGWNKARDHARASLGQQINTVALPDSSKPKYKSDLLDEAVRRCFNANPPIAIKISVLTKHQTDSDASMHDIALAWGTDSAGNPFLSLTMICPYES